MEVFKSKYGFHPVSWETSRKLRFINGLYSRAKQLASAWERWNRKLPHNRILKQKVKIDNKVRQEIVRDNKGKPVLWPEPAICELFFTKKCCKSQWLPNGYYSETPMEFTKLEDNGFGIIIRMASKQARMPYSTEESVKPLNILTEEIDKLYLIAKNFNID